MISEIKLRRRVQFHETDLAGFVHFSCFFRYMEEAEHALWREAGLSIAPPGALIGWPRLSASFDFHRTLHFEDEFDIWLRIVSMGARTIEYACVLLKDEDKIATGRLTIACVNRAATPMRTVDIPPEIRERLQAAPDTSAAAG